MLPSGRQPSYLRQTENGPFASTAPNETTQSIMRETLRILHWEQSIRSAVILALTVSFVLIVRQYSLLLIASAVLSIAIGFNLLYVALMVDGIKLVTGGEVGHPYRQAFEKPFKVDQEKLTRCNSVVSDVLETLIQAGAYIVLIKDNATSLKWFAFCCVLWAVSTCVSASTMILFFVVSVFIFPRLYISNKSIVDVNLRQGGLALRAHVKYTTRWASGNLSGAYTVLAKPTPERFE